MMSAEINNYVEPNPTNLTLNPSPSLSITITDEDNNQSTRKLSITKKELSTLKFIYRYIMIEKVSDCFIESSSYKNLMNKNLVRFSATYRNVILTEISENILKQNKSFGSYTIEIEDGSMEVSWKGFN